MGEENISTLTMDPVTSWAFLSLFLAFILSLGWLVNTAIDAIEERRERRFAERMAAYEAARCPADKVYDWSRDGL